MVEWLPAPRKTVDKLYAKPNPDGTDIAAALRLGERAVP
jgi:hypothetical protein